MSILASVLIIIVMLSVLGMFGLVMFSQPDQDDDQPEIVYTQAGKVTRHGIMKR